MDRVVYKKAQEDLRKGVKPRLNCVWDVASKCRVLCGFCSALVLSRHAIQGHARTDSVSTIIMIETDVIVGGKAVVFAHCEGMYGQ